MRFAFEGETGFGDMGVQPQRLRAPERFLQEPEIEETALKIGTPVAKEAFWEDGIEPVWFCFTD